MLSIATCSRDLQANIFNDASNYIKETSDYFFNTKKYEEEKNRKIKEIIANQLENIVIADITGVPNPTGIEKSIEGISLISGISPKLTKTTGADISAVQPNDAQAQALDAILNNIHSALNPTTPTNETETLKKRILELEAEKARKDEVAALKSKIQLLEQETK